MLLNPKLYTTKAATTLTQTTDSDFNNGTMENLTVMGKGIDSELKINFSEQCKWFNITSSIDQNPRTLITAASISTDDKVLLFGGYNVSYYNETWIFDYSDNNWTKKAPSNNPDGRYTAMASIYGHDKVILFGGRVGNDFYSDTWIYDLSNDTWTMKTPSNSPSARAHHAMASIYGTDKVLIYGGYYKHGVLFPETWIYDLSNNTWTNKITANIPNVRMETKMASVYGTDKVILFGGQNRSWTFPAFESNFTWVYDLSDNTWTNITPPGVNPHSRDTHSLATIPGTDRVLLYGGLSYPPGPLKLLNDTWVFDFSNNTWTEINLSFQPPWRRYNALAPIYSTNNVLLFGGFDRLQYNKTYNDTWIFKNYFAPSDGMYISQPIEVGCNSTLKTIHWGANIPYGTSLTFQLRSAATESGLNTKTFVGPNGTNESYYNNSEHNIWLGHKGDSWVQVKAYFHIEIFSDSPMLQDLTVTYNKWPSTTLINPLDESKLVDYDLTFDWAFSDLDSVRQKAFQVLIDDDIEFRSNDYNSGQQNSTKHSWHFPFGTNYTNITDGIWYWKVRTKDTDGDWGLYSPPWKFILDCKMSKSTIITPIENRFYNGLNSIFGIAYDPPNGTGLNKVEITIKKLDNDVYWTGTAWTSEQTWLLTSGTTKWSYNSTQVKWTSGSRYIVQSRATDNASNVEFPDIGTIFTIDLEDVLFSDARPNADSESPTEEVQVGITISDSVSGVNASTVEYCKSIDDGLTWTRWTFVPCLENGPIVNVSINSKFPNATENRIKWRASDITGNGPTESDPYKIRIKPWEAPLKVRLWSPENASVIQTSVIELSWMLENEDLLNVTYDVYLDTVNPPNKINQSGVVDTTLDIDGLTNGETYYWMVLPRIGERNGTCISGVWSFKVEIPIPVVILISPENGSIIRSPKPTLVWSTDYNGKEPITYKVYLDTIPDPQNYELYSSIHYMPNDLLEDGETYYWKVVPWAGEIQGPASEVWSFTVNKNYIPRFKLSLVVEPALLEITPGEMKLVKARITNLGEVTDKISLIIDVPAESRLEAILIGQSILELASGDSVEVNITIKAMNNIENDEVILTIVALSVKAAEYGKLVEDNAKVMIKILYEEKKEQDKSSAKSNYWILLISIIIVIILIVLFIVATFLKRNKEPGIEQKETPLVKPDNGPNSVKSIGQVPQLLPTPTVAESSPTIVQEPNE